MPHLTTTCAVFCMQSRHSEQSCMCSGIYHTTEQYKKLKQLWHAEMIPKMKTSGVTVLDPNINFLPMLHCECRGPECIFP